MWPMHEFDHTSKTNQFRETVIDGTYDLVRGEKKEHR